MRWFSSVMFKSFPSSISPIGSLAVFIITFKLTIFCSSCSLSLLSIVTGVTWQYVPSICSLNLLIWSLCCWVSVSSPVVVTACLLLFLLVDFSHSFAFLSLFPQFTNPLSYCASIHNFSGSLSSYHPCTFRRLRSVVSTFHKLSCNFLYSAVCNIYIATYHLFPLLSKPFFVLPLYVPSYFGFGGFECEWVVRLGLPRGSNLPQP